MLFESAYKSPPLPTTTSATSLLMISGSATQTLQSNRWTPFCVPIKGLSFASNVRLQTTPNAVVSPTFAIAPASGDSLSEPQDTDSTIKPDTTLCQFRIPRVLSVVGA